MIERTDARAGIRRGAPCGCPKLSPGGRAPTRGAPTSPVNEMVCNRDTGTRGKGTHKGCPYG